MTANSEWVRPSPNTCRVTQETPPIHPVGDRHRHSPGGAIGRIGLDQPAVDASHVVALLEYIVLCCVVYTCTIILQIISAQTFLHSLNYMTNSTSQMG